MQLNIHNHVNMPTTDYEVTQFVLEYSHEWLLCVHIAKKHLRLLRSQPNVKLAQSRYLSFVLCAQDQLEEWVAQTSLQKYVEHIDENVCFAGVKLYPQRKHRSF